MIGGSMSLTVKSVLYFTRAGFRLAVTPYATVPTVRLNYKRMALTGS
jgi:hypothetical protein